MRNETLILFLTHSPHQQHSVPSCSINPPQQPTLNSPRQSARSETRQNRLRWSASRSSAHPSHQAARRPLECYDICADCLLRVEPSRKQGKQRYQEIYTLTGNFLLRFTEEYCNRHLGSSCSGRYVRTHTRGVKVRAAGGGGVWGSGLWRRGVRAWVGSVGVTYWCVYICVCVCEGCRMVT